MVLGDRNPNRTSLSQSKNSLIHTHTWGKAEDSVGFRTRLQMYYAWDESLHHCPDPQHVCIHTATPLLPISFLRLKAIHLLIYMFQFQYHRVKTCFYLSYLMCSKVPGEGFIGMIWIGVHTCAEKLRVTRILFQLGLYAFSCNNKTVGKGEGFIN